MNIYLDRLVRGIRWTNCSNFGQISRGMVARAKCILTHSLLPHFVPNVTIEVEASYFLGYSTKGDRKFGSGSKNDRSGLWQLQMTAVASFADHFNIPTMVFTVSFYKGKFLGRTPRLVLSMAQNSKSSTKFSITLCPTPIFTFFFFYVDFYKRVAHAAHRTESRIHYFEIKFYARRNMGSNVWTIVKEREREKRLLSVSRTHTNICNSLKGTRTKNVIISFDWMLLFVVVRSCWKKTHIRLCFVVAFIDSGPANETKATQKKYEQMPIEWINRKIESAHFTVGFVLDVWPRNRHPARIFCGHFSIIFVCSDKMVANWTWYGSSKGRVRERENKRPAAAAFDRTEPSHCLVAVITDSRSVTAILFVFVRHQKIPGPMRWNGMKNRERENECSIVCFFIRW